MNIINPIFFLMTLITINCEAVEAIPEWAQVRLRGLYWMSFHKDTGKPDGWVRGNELKEFPSAMGRIEEGNVVWNHQIYKIISHAPVPNREGAYSIKCEKVELTIQKINGMSPGIILVKINGESSIVAPNSTAEQIKNSSKEFKWIFEELAPKANK